MITLKLTNTTRKSLMSHNSNGYTNGQGTELTLTPIEVTPVPSRRDLNASPFKVMVDPAVRHRLRQALLTMIDSHDSHLADYVSEGKLDLDSYKEYIELFAKSLRESMESKENVHYLMSACGFDTEAETINLNPQWRWRDRQ